MFTIGEEVASNHVCIIEDNIEIVEAMKSCLEEHNFKVVSYGSAEEFYEKRDKDFKGLYLIDWHLPGEPGINIVNFIRSKDKVSPIFIVSAFSQNSDIVTGLKAGADDYITKPFNFDELIARVQNASRKFDHVTSQTDFDGIRLLPKASSFIKDGETVSLTEREYRIFDKLFLEKENAVSREDLIKCFSDDESMTVRNIDVHVFSLRKKIKEVDMVIETVRGVGYKLV